MSIQAEIENTHSKIARVETLLAGLTPTQLARLDKFKVQTERQILRQYGNRLNQGIVDMLLYDLILKNEVLTTVAGGGIDETPKSESEWKAFVSDIVENESLAQANLVSSDAAKRAEIRDRILKTMRPETKIAMARAKTIDKYLDDAVSAEIEKLAGLYD